MKISIYSGIKSTTPTKDSSIFKVLDIIKSDDLKIKIAKIRVETDKEKRNLLKQKLQLATFCGTFVVRSKTNLKKPSGLTVLDFDDVKDLAFLIESVNKDKYTFSSFVSPSGTGLKVLVKIPPVDNDDDYKDYYHELQKYYDKYAETDKSTIDISRATYLSYDPKLFLNSESELFTDRFIRPIKKIEKPTNVPLTDQNEIAERLEKWFKKRWTATNRNTNLHSYARQYNAFGVDISICENYLLRYEQPDFKEREILALIQSAYKYSAEFNTVAFEDKDKVKSIKNQILAGRQTIEVEGMTPENLAAEVDLHKSKMKQDVFWYFTEKEAIKMSPNLFKLYMNYNHISKYYPSVVGGYIFIKKEGNFIREFNEDRIKDFVLDDLENRAEMEAWDMCANSLITFSKKNLGLVGTKQLEIQRDTKNESYIFYKNTAVEVTKDSFITKPYESLKGLVWEDQVINRDLVLEPESEGEFKTFIWKICGEDKERYYTMKSVLGYLLHSYQNEGKPKVIIFNDEMISDAPNGGSGKGLIHKAISYIKKLSTINGKGFDPSTQFAYQTVDTDTQVLLFDDIDKNFKFENLFSLITEGLVIEKKGKDAIKIPFNESPKISITTNYTVKGDGGSHKRRVFEVEMASYFNADHTPEDEFGHLLFSDWDAIEYAKFDNYMLRCIQYYLKNGLVESATKNLELRKLRNETNTDFIDFMETLDFESEMRYYKTELKDAFVLEYDDFRFQKWFTSNTFNKWVQKFCDFKGLVLDKRQDNKGRYMTIGKLPF